MSLTVTNTGAPFRAGPGWQLFVHQSTIGPIPNDDFYAAWFTPVGGGNALSGGSVRANGLHDVSVVLGIDPILSIAISLDFGLAPGAAVDLHVAQYHANFTNVDSAVLTGWTWEPVNGLFVLIGRSVADTKSQQILDAVKQTYVNAP